MNYQHFIAVTKEKIAVSLGDDVHLHVHTALKNNGRERTGLTISDNSVNVFPTIYLEEFYLFFASLLHIDQISAYPLNKQYSL